MSQTASEDNLLDARTLSKLHWRCRRGLLENDLLIDQFFKKYESTLTLSDADALYLLMDLSDNDLLDLLLRRKSLSEINQGELNTPKIQSILSRLQPPAKPVL